MNPTTFTSRAAAGLVAGIAGFASYNHIVSVARHAGEHGAVAAVLPLSIDGLIVVGTMAMIDDKKHNRKPRWSARVALGFGVIATLAANVASAQPGVKAALVAAMPALAFLIAVEVLARSGRPAGQDVLAAVVDGSDDGESAVDPWDYAVPIGPEPALEPVRVDNLSAPQPARKPHPTAEPRVIAAHRRTPHATDEQIAKRLKLSVKTVHRYRPDEPTPALIVEPERINGHKVLETTDV